VLGWGVARDERDGFRVQRMESQPQHVVLRVRQAAGRVRLVGAWKEVSREDVLKALADPASPMTDVAWVEREEGKSLPPSGEPGQVGTVQVERGQAHVKVQVEATRPALLVLSDHLTPGFRATVNGQEVPLRRVHHLLMGVPVPAGRSEVVVRYVPVRIGPWLAQGGLLLGLVGGVFASRSRDGRTGAR
jgi:Bacterial membrane protein YfhO